MKLVIKQHGLFINIPSIPPFRTPAEVDISKVPINMVIGEMRKNGICKYEIKTKNIELLKNTISKLVNKTEMKKIKVSYEKDGITIKNNLFTNDEILELVKTQSGTMKNIEDLLTKFLNSNKTTVIEKETRIIEKELESNSKKVEDEKVEFIPSIDLSKMKVRGSCVGSNLKVDSKYTDTALKLIDIIKKKG
jgi:hypothetical protein